MGDTTQATFILWHASPSKKAKIEAFLSDLACNEVALAFGAGESLEDVRCGTVDENASDLVDLAPKAIWQFFEDPKYEFSGTYAWHHPEVGLLMGECDADGRPVVAYEQLEDTGILADPDSYRAIKAAQEKVAKLYGRPFLDLIEESRGPVA